MIDLLTPQTLTVPNGLIAGFTTRKGGVSNGEFDSLNLGYSVKDFPQNVSSNRTALFNTLGISDAHFAIPHQTHSKNIAMVQSPGEFDDTDALITHESNIYLTVQTADCLPILIWTHDGEWVAAIHSGWRGTEQGIVSETLALLLSGSGYLPSEYLIWIGPGLGVCHFEVGAEFEEKFDPKYLELRDGKLHFDNLTAIMDQIVVFDIPMENIEIVNECTYCESEKYFSHRRDNGKTGRMMAIIGRNQ